MNMIRNTATRWFIWTFSSSEPYAYFRRFLRIVRGLAEPGSLAVRGRGLELPAGREPERGQEQQRLGALGRTIALSSMNALEMLGTVGSI